MSLLPMYFFENSFLSCIDVVSALLAYGYVIAFSSHVPCIWEKCCVLYVVVVNVWLNFSSVAYCIKEV